MVRPLVTYPDVEALVVDELEDLLSGEATVGVGVPDGWTPASGSHVQVACDGTVDEHPISQRHTIRLTAWAEGPSEAKRVLNLAHGHLLATAGNDAGLSTVSPQTGLLPAYDDDHGADLASCTLSVRVRSTPIT